MPLTFAYRWNTHYDRQGNAIGNFKIAGREFTANQARLALRQAFGLPVGEYLRTAINEDTCRLINGPHKSERDTRLHMTIHAKGIARETTFHVYVHKDDGHATGVSEIPPSQVDPRTGNPGDDWDLPEIINANML